MKLRELASQVVVDPRKLTEYALNPENERGCHKARVFKAALGYTQDNYESLLEQIETQVLEAEAVVQRTDEYGRHVRVEVEIVGVADQRAVVRTGWLIAPDSDEARLITLYVRKPGT